MLRLLNSRLLLLITICLGLSWAQTYSILGRVLDLNSRESINNANIYIDGSDFGTITDSQGYFTLYINSDLDDEVTLKIRMIGYKEKNIQLNLSEKKIDLDNIFLEFKNRVLNG